MVFLRPIATVHESAHACASDEIVRHPFAEKSLCAADPNRTAALVAGSNRGSVIERSTHSDLFNGVGHTDQVGVFAGVLSGRIASGKASHFRARHLAPLGARAGVASVGGWEFVAFLVWFAIVHTPFRAIGQGAFGIVPLGSATAAVVGGTGGIGSAALGNHARIHKAVYGLGTISARTVAVAAIVTGIEIIQVFVGKCVKDYVVITTAYTENRNSPQRTLVRSVEQVGVFLKIHAAGSAFRASFHDRQLAFIPTAFKGFLYESQVPFVSGARK